MAELPDLAHALRAFKERRSARIADAIVELGERAAAHLTPPTDRTNLGFHRRWLALATDVGSRSFCLRHLTSKLPKLWNGAEHPAGEKSDAVLERLAVFAAVDPDPRVARTIVALLELRQPVTRASDVEELMWRLLSIHGDDGTRAALEAARALDDAEPEAIAALTLPAPVALDAAELATWGAIEPPRPKHDASALFREVLAAPRDDAPREVLADVLQETGDPRGAFIALQLREARGEASAEAIAEAEELIARHGKDWLGALRSIVYRAWFRRGFLSRLELAGAWSSNAWDTVAADPTLATIEEVDPGQANTKVYARFLESDALRSLRAVTVMADDVWAVVKRRGGSLVRLRCTGWKRHNYLGRFRDELVPFLQKNEQVTELACLADALALLPDGITSRLRWLDTSLELKKALALWRKLPRLERLVIGEIELCRAGDVTRVEVWPSGFFKHAFEQLAALPKSIDVIDVVGNAASANRIAAHHEGRFVVRSRRAPSGLVTGTKA